VNYEADMGAAAAARLTTLSRTERAIFMAVVSISNATNKQPGSGNAAKDLFRLPA